MSSFICSAKHFNSIEKGLCELINYNGGFYIPYSLKQKFPVLYHNTMNSKETVNKEVKKIIDELRRLNVICVSLQYRHHYEGVLDEEIKTQTEIVFNGTECKELTVHGLYNALRCLSYQIEIEHLEDLGGLKNKQKNVMYFLNEMINNIAHYLVGKMPDDKSNTWEIE